MSGSTARYSLSVLEVTCGLDTAAIVDFHDQAVAAGRPAVDREINEIVGSRQCCDLPAIAEAGPVLRPVAGRHGV